MRIGSYFFIGGLTMTSEQIVERFKEHVKMYGGMLPEEAVKYVEGDDSMYAKIPRGLRAFAYPQEIVAELDGENHDIASRCLKAVAAVRGCGIAGNMVHDELHLAPKIGFSLEEVLNANLENVMYKFSNLGSVLANYLEEVYKDETEKTITPKYLAKLAKEYDKRDIYYSASAAHFIAADLYIKKPEKAMKKQLIEFMKSCYSQDAVDLGAKLCRIDPEFAQILRDKLTDINSARKLYAGMLTDIDKTEDVMRFVGMYDEFLLCCALKVFNGKKQNEAICAIEKDTGKFLPLLVKYAHNGDFICKACKLLIRFEGKPGFAEAVGEMENYYTEILSCIDRSITVTDENGKIRSNSTMAARHIMHKDKEKAAKCIYLDTGRYSYSYMIEDVLSAFTSMSTCSTEAKDILNVFVMSYAYRYNSKKEGMHYEDYYLIDFAKFMNVYLEVRTEKGVSADAATDEIIDMGAETDMIFYAAAFQYKYSLSQLNLALPAAVYTAEKHPDDAVKFFDRIAYDTKAASYWAEVIYKKADCKDNEIPLKLLAMNSKVASKAAGNIISVDEERFRPLLEKAKLKGDGAKKAKEIIKKWDNERKFGKDFNFGSNELAAMFAKENSEPAADKLISFIPEEMLENIRYADLSGKADPIIIKYILKEYMKLSEPAILNDCSKLAEKLYAPDLERTLEEIYVMWSKDGADTKKKMILLPYCIYGSDRQITDIKKQLLAWAEASRGALAAFAVSAVAMNGKSTALLLVSDTAAKFPNNMVKKSATAAFGLAAAQLGVTTDVLADKIVPTLGFDKNGEIKLDFGSRTFTASLMPDLTISLKDDAKDKVIKSLPKPAASDDENKAAEAKQKLSDIKKQLKSVSASQKARLEAVFRNGRTWQVPAWKELFTENPIMHRFAGGLIWGIYRDGRPVSTFRYADDGTFCDENDNTFSLPEEGEISMIHPIELEKAVIEAWAEQLSDYEIKQPFPQLSAQIFTFAENEIGSDGRIEKYNDCKSTAGALTGAFKKYGLVRSSVEDAGGFSGYHLIDRTLNLGFCMDFEQLWMGQEPDDEVQVTDIYFYILPEKDEKPDSYNGYTPIDPHKISPRFVSCCAEILERVLN